MTACAVVPEVYESSRSSRPGWGYPSCNVEICRLPRNRNDPHGYYRALGVSPDADVSEIRAAVRALYRRLHPDTGAFPDPERLQRVKLIAEVLLDPRDRERYNHTPPGKRLLDKVYRSELSSFDFAGMDAGDMQRMLRPVSPPPPETCTGKWYDYLAVEREPYDMLTAQKWYGCLVSTAPLVGYRRRVKVLLQNGPAFFHPETAVMAIPRPWKPSTGLAFGLWVAVAEQRHPSWRCDSSYGHGIV